MSTVDKEMNMEAIIAIIYTIQVVVKIRFKIKLKSLLTVIVFGNLPKTNALTFLSIGTTIPGVMKDS